MDEIEILWEICLSLKMDDILLWYDGDVLVVSDEIGNEWRGNEFYNFLINEAFVYEDKYGNFLVDWHNADRVNAILRERLEKFKELCKEKGIDFIK